MADAPDYESMSREELARLRGYIDRAIATAGERERQAAREAAEAAAREHGFSLAELTDTSPGSGKGRGTNKRGGRAPAGSSGESVAVREAKYRNPENAEQTWSGRGRRPAWVNEAVAGGRALADLAV